jgi:hypothetical protein
VDEDVRAVTRVRPALAALAIALSACGSASTGASDGGSADAGPAASADEGCPADAGPGDPRFATRVVSFEPGEGAGYGQSRLPCVVLGPPHGGGDAMGSLDVLSLGRGGSIVLGFDREIVDGPGPDLIVFENPFLGFVETGVVAVSEDGQDWHEWACGADQPDAGYPGCAGVHPVYAAPGNGVDPADPATAGGDAFDLADLGVARARYVRVRDSGANTYQCCSGGFDLDAVAVVHGAPGPP